MSEHNARATVSPIPDEYEQRSDEEMIEVKPSTELIPDEYEHDQKNVSVHVFQNKHSDIKKIFVACLKKFDYEIPETHIHDINSKAEVLNDLEKISKNVWNKSGLIVLFSGSCDNKANIVLKNKETMSTTDVWQFFLNKNCLFLRNKPKIFIFLGSKSKYRRQSCERDSCPIFSCKAYDVPAETNILLIHKNFEELQPIAVFIRQLCQNIEKYGKREDIISIITHTDRTVENRPLIISTLTRKFYFISHDKRGHYFDLSEGQNNFKLHLKQLHDKIDKQLQSKS